MKQFIIAVVLFPFLLLPMIQFVINEHNHIQSRVLENIVDKSVKQASIDGYFTPENISNMKTEISNRLYIDQAEIIVSVTPTPKYRLDMFDQREMIQYDIEVPIDKLLAMNGFLGISDADNSMTYHVKGEIASERLP